MVLKNIEFRENMTVSCIEQSQAFHKVSQQLWEENEFSIV